MFFVYKNKNCPVLIWDNEALITQLADVRYQQGRLIGTMEALASDLQNEAILETLILDITKCAEIENIALDEKTVRISIASKLGMYKRNNKDDCSSADGITEVMMDAVVNCNLPLTADRLIFWYENLNQSKEQKKDNSKSKLSKLTKIKKVVYKVIGKNAAGFRELADKEMSNFINWINTENNLDPVIKAAIAHLWFVTIRPFEDGNARIAGIITNMLLARSDNTSNRFYSMLAQIKASQKQYNSVLEKTQSENFDITSWMLWFFGCMKKALQVTDVILQSVLKKSEFWKIHDKTPLNNRQRTVVNTLLRAETGRVQSSEWAQIAQCSTDTALRDIKDMIEKGILCKKTKGGRSTSYELVKF
ncbi:MAG: DUF4172 domain-containing protein [Prevotellaceae bacterium]|nr:DUF4172 domain-containing protein [Prevotellaceae bacterium]